MPSVYDEALEARKATASATSSGLPERPSGICYCIAAPKRFALSGSASVLDPLFHARFGYRYRTAGSLWGAFLLRERFINFGISLRFKPADPAEAIFEPQLLLNDEKAEVRESLGLQPVDNLDADDALRAEKIS